MHDLPVHQIVGDVEQAVDEAFVAGDAFSQHGVTVTARRRTLGEETAFRSDRHDDGVFDHLRLDQAQHFRAEILTTVGPAQATARNRAEAQMHAFDER